HYSPFPYINNLLKYYSYHCSVQMRTVRKSLPKRWWQRHINGRLSERQLKKAHGSDFSDFSENRLINLAPLDNLSYLASLGRKSTRGIRKLQHLPPPLLLIYLIPDSDRCQGVYVQQQNKPV